MRESRVAPTLQSQIDAGKIKLTSIVNTHQYVLALPLWSIKMLTVPVTGTTLVVTMKL